MQIGLMNFQKTLIRKTILEQKLHQQMYQKTN